jgi:GGDEF domain-containing protein
VCRIGGDEFCIILDGGGMLSAEPVMTLAARTFAESGTGRSLSCGIAFATPDVASPIDLLGVADEAQYEAKRRRKGLPPVAELPALGSRRRAHREH